MSTALAATRGPSRLLSDSAWNIAGQLLPLVAGILSLPLLIRLVGLERFGFISIVWVLVGYAGVFDFGIGRAVIRTVAVHLAAGDPERAMNSTNAGLFFLTLFGVVLAAALAIASPWLVQSVLKLPPQLLSEAIPATLLLSVSLPFVMLTTGFGGVISAHQRFKSLNILRIALGVASYLGPLTVALWSPRLDAIVAAVLALRIAGTLAHSFVCRHQCGWSPQFAWPQQAATRELFTLGGWIAVSNVLGPMLSYLDRLLLAALVPVRMVAVYATPYDVLSKAMILPYSMVASLFPRATAITRNTAAARQMLSDATRLLYLTMFPVIFAFVAFARPGLHSWLGPQIADQGATVLQILAVGVFVSALAQGPATLIQAAGEPRWMAKLHLIELPVFIAVLWLLTAHFGVIGTAVASSMRNILDAIAVAWIAKRRVASGTIHWRSVVPAAALAIGFLAVALWPSTWAQAVTVAVPFVLVFPMYVWKRLMSSTERARLTQSLGLSSG